MSPRWPELTDAQKVARLTAGRTAHAVLLERNRKDDEEDVSWNDNRSHEQETAE